MILRLIVWSLRRYLGGPARSWVLTGAAALAWRTVRRVLGRRPTVERISIAKGDHVSVDQLTVSHRRQIRQFRAERRQAAKGRPVSANGQGRRQ
jgi:hypothetical protein